MPMSKDDSDQSSPKGMAHSDIGQGLETHKVEPSQSKRKVRPSAKLMSEEDSFIDEFHQLDDGPPELKSIIEVTEEAQSEPTTPIKRKRGRPRKGENPKKPAVADAVPRRSSRKQELQKKREEDEKAAIEAKRIEAERRKRLKQQAELRDRELRHDRKAAFDLHNAERVKQGLDPLPNFEIEESPPSSPQKRKPSPKKPQTPKKKQRPSLLGSPSPSKGSPQRRSKKGRPSRQENVTKEVTSIFQMDDLEIFNNVTSSTPPRTFDKALPSINAPIDLNFDNKGQSSFKEIPTISGIKRPAPATTDQDITDSRKFTPFPMPAANDQGNSQDSVYIKTHLPSIASSLDPNARLADERAFFLDGSEGYFEQHSLRFRPSTNSLAAHAPTLDYEEFRPMVSLGELLHKEEKSLLRAHQRGNFHQWCMELSQGYNLNFYGVGSKVGIIMAFIENYLPMWYSNSVQDDDQFPGVMVINGYNPGTKLKSVIHDMVSVVVRQEDKAGGHFKMPKHVSEAFPFLIAYLRRNITQSEKNGVVKPRLLLVIHNLDGDAFREERAQNFISQIASLPNVWLISSTDHINVGLLWDLYRFKNFNFLWREVTTHEPYRVEMSFKDVLSAGKSRKFVGTKGVKHVLTSLTTNAKNLYKVLLRMQLQTFEETTASKAACIGLRGSTKFGFELVKVYEKCVEEYIASNKTNFNTMLHEFVEHKMCSLAKSKAGQEIAFVPYTYGEIEKIIEAEFST